MHSWEDHRNEEGQTYVTCRRCGKDGEKKTFRDGPSRTFGTTSTSPRKLSIFATG